MKTHSTWDTRSRRLASRYRLTGVGQTLAWHPSGNLLAVGSSNEALAIFDIRGGELNKPLHVIEKIVEVGCYMVGPGLKHAPFIKSPNHFPRSSFPYCSLQAIWSLHQMAPTWSSEGRPSCICSKPTHGAHAADCLPTMALCGQLPWIPRVPTWQQVLGMASHVCGIENPWCVCGCLVPRTHPTCRLRFRTTDNTWRLRPMRTMWWRFATRQMVWRVLWYKL